MTIIQATQADLPTVWQKIDSSTDTLELHGPITGWRPTARTFAKRLEVDGSQAVLSNCYAGGTARLDGINWHNLRIVGGPLVNRGFRIDAGANMTFDKPQLDGKGVVGVGLWLSGLTNVEVLGMVGVGFLRAMTLGSCSQFKVAGHDLSGFGSDGIDITSCQHGLVDDGSIHDPAPILGSHPDAIQLASPSGASRCADITISNQRIRGHMQGINLFNSVSMGQLGGEDITIRDGVIAIDYTWAVCLQDVLRGLIENMQVSTLPGAPAQAIIGFEYHDPAAVSTVERWGNVMAAYGSKPAILDPVRPAPPSPPPAPFDAAAAIAAIRAELDALEAGLGIAA